MRLLRQNGCALRSQNVTTERASSINEKWVNTLRYDTGSMAQKERSMESDTLNQKHGNRIRQALYFGPHLDRAGAG